MAEGIVLQIQKEALDDSVDIETLLRKAYLAARKLQLKDFEAWISCEQNGYTENIPKYRIIGGEIKAWNPYHGWIPVVLQGKAADALNHMHLSFPISTILDTYRNSNGSVAFSVSGALTEYLNNTTDGFITKYSFHSTKTELKKIISAVRNRILEWSLLLEENDIIGEGLGFSDTEIKTARESQVINNYTNNFYSTAENTQIQQGGSENQQ